MSITRGVRPSCGNVPVVDSPGYRHTKGGGDVGWGGGGSADTPPSMLLLTPLSLTLTLSLTSLSLKSLMLMSMLFPTLLFYSRGYIFDCYSL